MKLVLDIDEPLSELRVSTLLLLLLRRGERHRIDRLAVLVGEDNQQIGLPVVLFNLGREFLESMLIRHGALSGRYDDEEMVIVDALSQTRQVVPVLHEPQLSSQFGVNTQQVLADDI